MICKWVYIRGRPFNSWGGGGGGAVGDFEKKNPASACRKKKNCMQHKCNRKKFFRCCKKEKKNVAKLFHHSGGALQNRSKTATILFPCSLWTLDLMMLQNYCFICAMDYKLITSSIINGGNFFIKESSFNRQWKLLFSFLTETFLCIFFLFKYNIYEMPFLYFSKYNIFLSFSNAAINVQPQWGECRYTQGLLTIDFKYFWSINFKFHTLCHFKP